MSTKIRPKFLTVRNSVNEFLGCDLAFANDFDSRYIWFHNSVECWGLQGNISARQVCPAKDHCVKSVQGWSMPDVGQWCSNANRFTGYWSRGKFPISNDYLARNRISSEIKILLRKVICPVSLACVKNESEDGGHFKLKRWFLEFLAPSLKLTAKEGILLVFSLFCLSFGLSCIQSRDGGLALCVGIVCLFAGGWFISLLYNLLTY